MLMRTATQILASYRDAIWRRFEEITQRTDVPSSVTVPSDPEEALKLGMALGRKEGYGSGLVDGTQLGLDVGLDMGMETVDALLSQPVIFGQAGFGYPN